MTPFDALRAAGGRAAEIIAPPYDVVSREEALEYAAGKPANFLHVSRAEIGFAPGSDPHGAEIYRRAARNLAALIDSGAMIRSPRPAYFVYRMEFSGHGQTGLAGAASLAAYEAGAIKRHELTRPDKEADRVKHMQALNAQTGPVLLAHRPEAALAAVLEEITRRGGAPEIDVAAEDGVRHILWQVDDGETLDRIQSAADGLTALYIADGHHRTAAAARLAAARRGDDSAARERFLAVLFPSDRLSILAYNRIVRDLGALNETAFLSRLEAKFSLHPAAAAVRPERPGQIGLCLKSGWHRLDPRALPAGEAPVFERLDVSLLTDGILQPLLGIADPRTDARLDFIGGADAPERIQAALRSGEAAAGFTLFPTAMDDLMAVADSGQVMPPKSTWFEPKLADGLIAHMIG
ncbi:MAG: DUF1015 family protein [Alphaproteobacteria bacterium]|jgi:uncharacterized protein (DUF1015 family)|nr:DUF1015 family protein [Alphaproteobacteria bacterium]